ncbi:MAG: sensor histidine kinase, partial [Syntrophothermus sp.]
MFIKDRQMAVTLEEMVRRIETMSLVHQMLYKTSNLSRVDLKEYVASLAELIARSYNELSRKVKLKLELESIKVLFDTAIPCGLIINEILTNSYKYAFPDSAAGEIVIRLSQTDNGMISLELSDNGIGLTHDSYVSDTLGMKLIRGIAEDQLKGTLTLIQQKGVCYNLCFKDELYNERI